MAQNPLAPLDSEQAKLFVWVKGLESKVNLLLREVDIIKNDLLRKHVDLRKDLKAATGDLLETRREQERTLEKMDLIIRELKKTAGAEELLALRKYLDLWNPLHFATQRDVERLVELKLQEKVELKLQEKVVPSLPEEGEEEQTHKKEKHLPFV